MQSICLHECVSAVTAAFSGLRPRVARSGGEGGFRRVLADEGAAPHPHHARRRPRECHRHQAADVLLQEERRHLRHACNGSHTRTVHILRKQQSDSLAAVLFESWYIQEEV